MVTTTRFSLASLPKFVVTSIEDLSNLQALISDLPLKLVMFFNLLCLGIPIIIFSSLYPLPGKIGLVQIYSSLCLFPFQGGVYSTIVLFTKRYFRETDTPGFLDVMSISLSILN